VAAEKDSLGKGVVVVGTAALTVELEVACCCCCSKLAHIEDICCCCCWVNPVVDDDVGGSLLSAADAAAAVVVMAADNNGDSGSMEAGAGSVSTGIPVFLFRFVRLANLNA